VLSEHSVTDEEDFVFAYEESDSSREAASSCVESNWPRKLRCKVKQPLVIVKKNFSPNTFSGTTF
jgi:hypothetical protein